MATTHISTHEGGPGRLERIGGWLFRQRTLIPVPIVAVLLLVRAGEAAPSPWLWTLGAGFIAAGEAVRLWGVHHIGAISRTRSDRLGDLVSTGPFAHVRNPLYLGNIALWIGFATSARLLWMVPLILAGLGFEYHAIVRWEERLLAARLGDRYREYRARVPRWVPSLRRAVGARSTPAAPYSWRATFFSERGTLIAIAVGYVLLWVRHKV